VYALESRPVHPSQSAPLPRTIWEAARVRRAVHTIVSQPCSLLISPSDIGRRVRGAATAVGGSVNFASKKNSDSTHWCGDSRVHAYRAHTCLAPSYEMHPA
jgi:hypothetical protein